MTLQSWSSIDQWTLHKLLTSVPHVFRIPEVTSQERGNFVPGILAKLSLTWTFLSFRCFTTGWGKDAFGDVGKYQNILKEVDVPVIGPAQCQAQLRQTRLGYSYNLSPAMLCAGGEEGKDACKVSLFGRCPVNKC